MGWCDLRQRFDFGAQTAFMPSGFVFVQKTTSSVAVKQGLASLHGFAGVIFVAGLHGLQHCLDRGTKTRALAHVELAAVFGLTGALGCLR